MSALARTLLLTMRHALSRVGVRIIRDHLAALCGSAGGAWMVVAVTGMSAIMAALMPVGLPVLAAVLLPAALAVLLALPVWPAPAVRAARSARHAKERAAHDSTNDATHQTAQRAARSPTPSASQRAARPLPAPMGTRRRVNALVALSALLAPTSGVFVAPDTAQADTDLPLPLAGEAYGVAQSAYEAFDAHRYTESIRLAREAIRQRPDVVELRILLANGLAATRQWTAARRVLDEAIRTFGPEHALLARRRDIDMLVASRGAFGSVGDMDRETFDIARRAYRAYGRHDYDAAITDAHEAIARAPKVERLRILLIDALAADHRDDEAWTTANDTAQRFGDSSELRSRRSYLGARIADRLSGQAEAARARGDLPGAVRLAHEAVDHAPGQRNLWLQLISLEFAQDDLDAVAGSAHDAAVRNPDDALAWTLSGYARAALAAPDADADFSRALEVTQAASQANARDQRMVRVIIADVWLAEGRAQDALDLLTPLVPAPVDTATQASDDSRTADVTSQSAASNADTQRTTATTRTATQSGTDSSTSSGTDSDIDAAIALRIHRAKRQLAAQDGTRTTATDVPQGGPATAVTGSSNTGRTDITTTTAPAAPDLASSGASSATAIDPRARPIFDCHTDAYGASCDVYAADAGFAAARAARLATIRGDDHAAAVHAREAADAVPDDPRYRLALIDALVKFGDTHAAAQAAQTAIADGMLDGMDDLQAAFLAERAGDDALAFDHFQRADAAGKLPASAYADAGYSGLRSHHEQAGARYLERAIDAQEASADSTGATMPGDTTSSTPAGGAASTTTTTNNTTTTPQQALLDERAAHADATRTWGATASLNYRNGGSSNGVAVNPVPGAANNWQAGTEFWWRPLGSLGDRDFQVYARGYENFGVAGDDPSGASTLQAAIGARVKPFGSVDAWFALEKILPIGSEVRSDWLARAAWSDGFGTALRYDVPSWWTGVAYAELDHYLVHPSTFGTANVRFGRTFRIDSVSPNLTVFPHVVVGADYDSTIDHSVPIGIGPGVSARWWFRGDRYDTPRSFVDVSLQYRVRIAGDDRARGVFFGTVLSW